MRRPIPALIITFGVVFVFAYLLRIGLTKSQLLGVVTTPSETPQLSFIHSDRFYDPVLFKKGLIRRDTYRENAHILGGIIPHHLLSSCLIADFFARISPQQPETIILIGPNHHEAGDFRVITSNGGWQTQFGMIFPQKLLVDEIENQNLAGIDDTVLENEHSVSGIMDYIHYYLPETQVVPLILSGKLDFAEITRLADFLKEKISEKTILVSSVDFSHYLSVAEADKKDELTIEFMKSHDYESLLRLNNDHFDSPPAIVTQLLTMSMIGAPEFDIISHTNSGIILKNPYTETTSHFEIIFTIDR